MSVFLKPTSFLHLKYLLWWVMCAGIRGARLGTRWGVGRNGVEPCAALWLPQIEIQLFLVGQKLCILRRELVLHLKLLFKINLK